MNPSSNIYIGIAPDTSNNGFAVWNKEAKKLTVENRSFYDTIQTIMTFNPEEIAIVIEAGWLDTQHRSWSYLDKSDVIARKNYSAGEKHRTGKLLCEYLVRLGYQVQTHSPSNGRIKSETFEKLTGISKSTREQRDAAMLVFGK